MNYEQLIISKYYLSTLMLFLSPSLEMKKKKEILFAFWNTVFLLVDQEDLIYQVPFRDLRDFDSKLYITKNSEFLKI